MNRTIRDVLLFGAGFAAGAYVMHTVFRTKYQEYTIRGEGEDEEECTKQLLAYENHCYPNQIHVHTEMR